jgi:two-component system response regulator EvgA
VRRLLEVEGMTVVAEAGDGLEAIHVCIHHRPDVLVLDLGMPELNGFEVISRLRTIDDYPTIVAYVSKTSTDEDLIPAIHAAAGGGSFFSSGLRYTASTRPEIARPT